MAYGSIRKLKLIGFLDEGIKRLVRTKLIPRQVSHIKAIYRYMADHQIS